MLPIGILALIAAAMAVGLVLMLGAGSQSPSAPESGLQPPIEDVVPTAVPVVVEPLPVPSVFIAPGQAAQTIVNESPPATVFLFQAGVHYLTEIVPRDGDVYLGEPGTVLSGARLLQEFGREGALWYAAGQTQQGERSGECEPEYPTCGLPEDLFFDDVLLKRVATRAEVTPGAWYFDYAANRAYFADDPTGRKVEIGVLPHAFDGTAANVTIRGLVIEKYASPAQLGAIHAHDGRDPGPGGSHWKIIDNEIRWNHSAGIYIGTESTVSGNYVHHNGQLGLKGGGSNTLVEGNVITYNNTLGFGVGWEAGGAKFVFTNNLVVRDNDVGYNFGKGLWTDIDNVNTTYEDNRVFSNYANGIFHEISYDAIIRRNNLWDNGRGFDVWMWGGQITLANSSNVQVYENIVIVAATAGDGITLIQQKRGSGLRGTYVTQNNYVHHNQIFYTGAAGQSGAAADFDEDTLYRGNNRFDYNQYTVPSADSGFWEWRGQQDWDGFQGAGQEQHGEVLEPSRPSP